ncbi:MAG TPA: hypothetical protein VG074_06140 [Acidimicrobiales bacterium]|nr:hypothetical protein [Acidimicrobiales bacterium]
MKHFRGVRPRGLAGLTLVVFSLAASACLASTTTKTSSSTFSPSPSSSAGLHYAPNGDFSGNTYLLGAYGFNLADVGDVSQANALPAGVKGLVYLGLCTGVTSAFTTAVHPYVGNQKVFGFYLMDEPNPSSCSAANLKAESDWIHANDPGTKTFIIEENLSSTDHPTYVGGFNPANSDIDLYGLDPYPCRSELGNACHYGWIGLAVKAAKADGIPLADIVPVYQAFGGGTETDDGGRSYSLPVPSQEAQILRTWGSLVPTPVFDYAYSWGSQHQDASLSGSAALQRIFRIHNR